MRAPAISKDQVKGADQYRGRNIRARFPDQLGSQRSDIQSSCHLRQIMEPAPSMLGARFRRVSAPMCADMCVSSRFVGFGLADVYFKARFAILRTIKLGSRTIDA